MSDTTLTAHSFLAEPPADTPLFFKIVCNVASRIRHGKLDFILPDGRTVRFSGDDDDSVHGVIVVRDFAFARRTVFGGDIGFFESYADGQWETPDLTACLHVFARNVEPMQQVFHGSAIVEFFNSIRHRLNRNSKRRSRRNIMAHYDLGNAFYEKWLDPSMTYSSAYFENTTDLTRAQHAKYAALARSIDLKPGDSVLEIGSGWGGFAEYAAREVGASVVGLTLSPSQLDYARERIHRQGLSDKVEFRLQDYRDVVGEFDKIASIEMFEAVGMEYWPSYFNKVRDSLKPGGAAGLQIITIKDNLFDDYSRSVDFIQRYVFPGGMLPSPERLRDQMTRAGLSIRGVTEFGQDYARTLNEWRERFVSAWDEIRPLGFDERFRKLWQFYLSYCEAGFKAETINVCQVAATRA